MARKWWVLLTGGLGLAMLLVDITIVTVALPSMAHDLGASFSDLQWTIDAYTLSLAALMLVAGSLGDLLGHKRVFGVGLLVFSLSSLLCGLAPNALFLIVSRAAQGIGGAAMFVTSLALLAEEFKGRERGTALGIWGAIAGASLAVGPLVGGALTSGISWRWVFFINVPIGVLTFAMLLVKVAETRRRSVRPDLLGAAAFACALSALVFALIRGNPDGWTSTEVVTSFLVGGALLAVFLAIEKIRAEPMLELGLFRNRAFLGASLAAVALGASLFSMLLYITLYLQDILGYSPFQAGLRFLPLMLLTLLAAPIAGWLSAYVSVRLLLGAGLVCVGAGLALMTRVEADSGWTVLLAGFVIAGIGSGLTNPARASAAIDTVPEEKIGVGSGVNNTALQVGVAAGIAALGAIFQSRVQSILGSRLLETVPQLGERRHEIVAQATSGNIGGVLPSLPPALREPVIDALRVAFVSGFDRILWISAAVGIAGAVSSLALVRQRDFVRQRKPR